MRTEIDLNQLPISLVGESTPEPLLYAFQRKASAHAGEAQHQSRRICLMSVFLPFHRKPHR